MADLADEETDAAALGIAARAEMPEEAELPPGAGYLWRCWKDLENDRQVAISGMGGIYRAPIPWQAAKAWADHHGVGPDHFEGLWAAVTAIDTEYRHILAERDRKAAEQAGG